MRGNEAQPLTTSTATASIGFRIERIELGQFMENLKHSGTRGPTGSLPGRARII